MAGVAGTHHRTLSLVALAAVLVALLALAPTGGASPARTAANRVTFEDSTGEDAQGPDITTVVLSNDDRGTLTWVINVPNRPTLTGDMVFGIFINSDSNAATGDAQFFGADYLLELDGPLSGPAQVGLLRWNGTDFTAVGVPQTSLIFGYANGVLTIRMNASELGNARRMQFLVIALTGFVLGPDGQLDDTNVRFDGAPDPGRGMYSFDVRITPPRLVVRSVGMRPPTPRAGRPFSVFVTFARSDGTRPTAPSVTCRATLGGRALAASGSSVAGGRATCRWALPSTASGQTIRGTVTVRSGGLRVSRSFTRRIG